MKLLFVQSDSLNPVVNSGMHIYNFQPLGLYYLAATVKDEQDVDLLDLNIEGHILKDRKEDPFSEKLETYKPDVVAFSALTSPRTGRIKELCSVVKKFDRRTSTIVGGVHASLMPSDFYGEDVDLIIKGNAVENFRRAIQLIEKGEKPHKISETVNSNLPERTSLDRWPMPYRELGRRYNPFYQIAIGKPGKSRIRERISSVKVTSVAHLDVIFVVSGSFIQNTKREI